MTVNNRRQVDKMSDLLAGLRETVRDAAAREEKLRTEFGQESGRLQQRCNTALEEEDKRLATGIQAVETRYLNEVEKSQAQHWRRKARVGPAQKAARQRRLAQVEAEGAQITFDVQKGLLENDRNREEALKQAKIDSETLNGELARERDALAVVERQARVRLAGYRKFGRLLSTANAAWTDLSNDRHQLLDALRRVLRQTEAKLQRFRFHPLPALFRFLPVWLLVPLVVSVHVPLFPALKQFHLGSLSAAQAAMSLAASVIAILALYFIGRRVSEPAARAVATGLAQARALLDACEQTSRQWYERETARINTDAKARTDELNSRWKQASRAATERREFWEEKLHRQAARALNRNDELDRQHVERFERNRTERIAQLRSEAETRKREQQQTLTESQKKFEAKYAAHWQKLTEDWSARMQSAYTEVSAAQAEAQKLFPPWPSDGWTKWTPPEEFAQAVKFGELEVNLETLAGKIPADERLRLPGPASFSVPLLLTFPQQGCIVFETKDSARAGVSAALNNIILRLLSVAPAGRVNFTIFDPVELGQNFAGLMHLADFEAPLINGRIWTQTAQIEEQLARLNEHIEKVTQMYLRNEYATIAEYNEQAGRIAEKYLFLVIADFPTNFSDLAVKRLLSVAASGPRCGVYTLIHWDQRKSAPFEFVPDELRKASVCVQGNGRFALANRASDGTTLRLDAPPEAELATDFLQRVGRHSVDSNRVEMPFAEVVPPEPERWSLETTTELRVPIGRTGATKLQYLALGKGTRQHALIAGKTGSGKSTLFHVLITNLALWCSPEQAEFYLVDFKKGVEFKCYATHRLPHARVVAIESDREFGLSVLQRVDEELKRRGELFRKFSAQDIAGYKNASGADPMPRTLLLIDEFQEFFIEDDRISQQAALLLDRVVRQGRAFGIHVLLGSQTLAGAYTLARATLGQMVVRVALQCNEADAYLIMDENNSAPRLLSRAGEAIYNDTAGTLAGNSPFQVVWLPEDERDMHLQTIRSLADRDSKAYPGPIVFEGNAPADVEDNLVLRGLLEAESIKPASATRVWLGAPNSIKGPTETVFRRQSGNNLLIVGQHEEAALALLTISIVSLAAQHPRGTARFILCDTEAPDSAHHGFLERLARAVPHPITFTTNADLDQLMSDLVEEMERRSAGERTGASPTTYLFIHNLQRFKKLRQQEDFSLSLDDGAGKQPSVLLNKLICEGTSLGFHVICTCDTVNNVNRFLTRKALSEFEMRVLFQMSANDSATLIDSPKANNLGLHRALFYNEQEGYLETFRPYALPKNGWIEQVGRSLVRLLG